MEIFQQQQPHAQHANSALPTGGGQLNPIQFHPSQGINQQAYASNNRNEGQLHTGGGNIGQLRNNSVGSQNNDVQPGAQAQPVKIGAAANLRPISRGDLTSQRANVQNNINQNTANGNAGGINTYHIHNDQQTFQLPPGSMPGAQPFQYTGGPGMISGQQSMVNGAASMNGMQPQFHFIANQQKFYAQIAPDKAPMLFRYNSEKRPFTAADQMMGLGSGIIAASQQISETYNGPMGQAAPQTQHQSQTRGNSKHGSSSKSGRVNNLKNAAGSAGNPNPMPYLQMAAKTHSGAFPLQQMQLAAGGAGAGVSKYVSSTGQLILDQQPSTSQQSNQHNGSTSGSGPGSNPHHLISIFSGQSAGPSSQTLQSIMNAQNQNHLKVSKIKPGKNAIKEKEQLYEDAIKLKIQSNTYREENVKLKTKIKILENEMLKKDKAMEDFIAKMNMAQVPNSSSTGTSSAHQTGSMFYQPIPSNSKHQMPANINGVTSQPPNLNANGANSFGGPNASSHLAYPLSNNYVSALASTAAGNSSSKFQAETFLVMSLKKQLKEAKADIQRRDEELEVLKKNIKTTQKVEQEVELKAYQDELLRMRFLMEDLMKEGPNHPIYQKQAQDKIRVLEQQLQAQEFMAAQLRQDNTDLAQLVRAKEEEREKKATEKEKKGEIKNELNKVKKTLKDKEREVAKLKQDVNNLRRQLALSSNKDGTNTTDITAGSTNKTANEDISTNTNPSAAQNGTAKKDGQSAAPAGGSSDAQLKILQKKNRDLLAELKTKKDKLDEQDQVIKKLQERLQSKLDELTQETKKLKALQEEVDALKLERERGEKEEKLVLEVKSEAKKEIEYVSVLGQTQGKTFEEMSTREYLLKALPVSSKLLTLTKELRAERFKDLFPSQVQFSQDQERIFMGYLATAIAPVKSKLLEACDLELHEDGDEFIKFWEFEEALGSAGVKIHQGKGDKPEEKQFWAQLLSFLRLKYFTKIQRKGFECEIGFLFKKFLSDLEEQQAVGVSKTTANRLESAKPGRPQTAKSTASNQASSKQRLNSALVKIKEDAKEREDEDDEEVYEDEELDLQEAQPKIKQKQASIEEDNEYEEDFEEAKTTPGQGKAKKLSSPTKPLANNRPSQLQKQNTSKEESKRPQSKSSASNKQENKQSPSKSSSHNKTSEGEQIKKQLSLKQAEKGQETLNSEDGKNNLEENAEKKRKRPRSGGSAAKTLSPGDPLDAPSARRDTDGLEEEGSEIKRFMDEEEMLDIAEHCFIRIAEMLIERGRTARSVFTKYSVPEQFPPDGTILELMSPIAFLEGVKEAGMEELSEMEAACLLRVLAKPELDNAIILNEFIMIMENFGVVDNFEEDEDDDDDYIKTDDETLTEINNASKAQLEDTEEEKRANPTTATATEEGKETQAHPSAEEAKQIQDEEKKNDKTPAKAGQSAAKSQKKKKKIQLNFDLLEEKGLKILRKLARFLLERYLHPREFFGPAIYKQLVKTKKRENHVEIMQTKDFYLRLKIAGVRKTVKEIENLNNFLCLDAKFPHLMQVKRVIKALEEVAQGEQAKLQEEMIKKQEDILKAKLAGGAGSIVEEANEDEEETDGDIGEDEKNERKAKAKTGKDKKGTNSDLIRETGGGIGLLTGGPHSGYSGYSMGGGMRGAMGGLHSSKIQMLMGFNHLNTIEEEKHETQNSAYFRDGDESHREESRIHGGHEHSAFFAKGSRILDELELSSAHNKHSPGNEEDGEGDYEQAEGEDNEEYEEDEDEVQEGENQEEIKQGGTAQAGHEEEVKSIQDMKSVEDEEDINFNHHNLASDRDNIHEENHQNDDQAHQEHQIEEEPVEDDIIQSQNSVKSQSQAESPQKNQAAEAENEDEYEEESDYEI